MNIPVWFSTIGTFVGPILTSAIGAYLALWAKDRWSRSDQQRDADIARSKNLQSILPLEWAQELSGVSFYGGVPKNSLKPIEQLLMEFPSLSTHHFHDAKLNKEVTQLLSSVSDFQEKIAALTTTDGSNLSTKYRASDIESKKRGVAEGNQLDQIALQLSQRIGSFVDLARRQLRI